MTSWTLAIDTATGINVGLGRDGEPYAALTESSSRRHVEALQPMIDQLLGQAGIGLAELDQIAVGIGPGPFTGLRIGIVTARTLGMVTDARRKELYWARYGAVGQRTEGPAVADPAQIPALPAGGPGVEVYPEVFAGRVPAAAPKGLDAALVAARINELPETGLEPAYLRKPDAEAPKTRKSALAGGRLKLPTSARLEVRAAGEPRRARGADSQDPK